MCWGGFGDLHVEKRPVHQGWEDSWGPRQERVSSIGTSVLSDSVRPHGLQPTRLLRPWDFPGKSTGVGCHCLLPSFTLEDRYFEVNIKEIKLKSRQVVCQFHTNKCRSSINVHTFLVPTLFYMYWTFAVFAPTSISSFHHDFAVATMSFNSQLLSFR